jgi:hypothetical protein
MTRNAGFTLVFLGFALAAACSVIGPSGSGAMGSAPPPAAASSAPVGPGDGSVLAGYVDPDEAARLAEKCQVVGDIASYFVIPPGSDYHSIFPAAGKAPELDGIDGLFVVVYSGDVDVLNLVQSTLPAGVTAMPLTFRDALCFVAPSGAADVYYNVSRDNMALPPGAHSGPPPSMAQ